MNASSSPDKAFEIPIRLFVQDNESDSVQVILQWSVDGEFESLDGIVDLTKPSLSIEELDHLRDILVGQDEGSVALRLERHILTAAISPMRGLTEHCEDCRPDQIRTTGFVREGLVFLAPGQDGPTEWQAGPFDLESSSEISLLGRRIRFLAFSEGSCSTARVVGEATITAFDPARSVATLSQAIAPAAGTHYELLLTSDVTGLASSPDGIVHSFIWDAAEDLRRAMLPIPLDSAIELRAIAIDSEPGVESLDALRLESGFLEAESVIETDLGASSAAIGDIDGDGANDLLVVSRVA